MAGQRGRWPRLNLQHRMMLLFSAIILALLASVLLYIQFRVTADMRSQVYDRLKGTRALFAKYLDLRREDLGRRCMIFAKLPRLRAAVTARSPASVAEVLNDYADILGAQAVLVVGSNGVPLAAWPDRSPVGREVFRSSLYLARHRDASGASVQSTVDVSPHGMYQTAWATILNVAGNQPVGILFVGTPIDRRWAGDLKTISDTEITFFARLNRPESEIVPSEVVASSLDDEQQKRLDLKLREEGREPLNVPAQGLEEPYVIEVDGVSYLAATYPVRGPNRKVVGAFVVQRPLDPDLKVVERLQHRLLVVGLVAALAALGASYLLANGVARRVMGVVRVAEGISRGDWSQRVPVEGPEELRTLAEA
ncbi:MAG: cache domain-containing protein, partial [Armatimonadota bacterium]|nr:cache domain-containing protein [Armatimonadota bacterium]